MNREEEQRRARAAGDYLNTARNRICNIPLLEELIRELETTSDKLEGAAQAKADEIIREQRKNLKEARELDGRVNRLLDTMKVGPKAELRKHWRKKSTWRKPPTGIYSEWQTKSLNAFYEVLEAENEI